MKPFISWQASVEEYLEHRRIFGNDLTRQGSILFLFAKHLDDSKFISPLTTEVQIEWIANQVGKTSSNRSRKLHVLRLFSKYLSLFDPNTGVPEKGFFGKGHFRFIPHVYSDEELQSFFAVLKTVFKNKKSVSGVTYEYAFRLILACGLRASEVVNIFCEDIDFEQGIIKIVESKFKKTRLLPIDPSVVAALREYKKLRDQFYPRCRTSIFFVLSDNMPLTYSGLGKAFYEAKKKLGWKGYMTRRIHDLRHTFVVKRLIAWHKNGEDTEKKIAALSVYIGHAKVSDTYWYIHFVPELMELVSNRFESFREERTQVL